MKRSTVDLVVTGDEKGAVAAAVDAVRRGQRVLVVLRSDGPRVVTVFESNEPKSRLDNAHAKLPSPYGALGFASEEVGQVRRIERDSLLTRLRQCLRFRAPPAHVSGFVPPGIGLAHSTVWQSPPRCSL